MTSSGTNLVGGRGEQNLKRSPASLSANQLSVDRVHLNTFSAIDHPDEHNAIVSADDQHADDADNADDQHPADHNAKFLLMTNMLMMLILNADDADDVDIKC